MPTEQEKRKLMEEALAEFEKIQTAAYKKYRKPCIAALAEYEKIQRFEQAKYEKILNPARAKYGKRLKEINAMPTTKTCPHYHNEIED